MWLLMVLMRSGDARKVTFLENSRKVGGDQRTSEKRSPIFSIYYMIIILYVFKRIYNHPKKGHNELTAGSALCQGDEILTPVIWILPS